MPKRNAKNHQLASNRLTLKVFDVGGLVKAEVDSCGLWKVEGAVVAELLFNVIGRKAQRVPSEDEDYLAAAKRGVEGVFDIDPRWDKVVRDQERVQLESELERRAS